MQEDPPQHLRLHPPALRPEFAPSGGEHLGLAA